MRDQTNKRVKRTQRDYNLGFKLALVAEVEKDILYAAANNPATEASGANTSVAPTPTPSYGGGDASTNYISDQAAYEADQAAEAVSRAGELGPLLS